MRGDLTPPPLTLDPAAARARAVASRPDLEAARVDIALARARIKKEEAEGGWDMSVSVGYQRQDFGYDLNGLTGTGATRPIRDVFHYFGGGMTIPLPVRNRNQANVAAATADLQAAERRLEFATLVPTQEVMAAFTQDQATERASSSTRGACAPWRARTWRSCDRPTGSGACRCSR